PGEKYDFKQVAVLSFAYLVTFGSELAVVSMLPAFFEGTWGLSPQLAGMVAAGYAFMNLGSRPMGGLLSDKLGSRKRTLIFLLGGLGAGYFLMSSLNSTWPLPLALLITMFCSFFVQAGEGAVFAMVPLVKKRITGQVAGMVGAFGSVGAVLFLTVLSFVPARGFFLTIAGTSLAVMASCRFIKEPKGSFADVHHDEIQPSLPLSVEEEAIPA
ncbi:MAG: MFS transporter, partial [bacterium]|nr:MFS transporter [bacterium]